MPSVRDTHALLIEQFVASFATLDEMAADEILDPIAWKLAIGEAEGDGSRVWRPLRSPADPSCLPPLYAALPARLPRLYELLILTYRWAEVDLQKFRLLANPPGPDFSGLLHEMSKDRFLWNVLIGAGFIRFGKGTDVDYDPVCFDLSSRKKNNDYRVVKIDHEEILCNSRIKIVMEVAASFEDLVRLTIAAAQNVTNSAH